MCQQILEFSDVPIVMLTAKGDDEKYNDIGNVMKMGYTKHSLNNRWGKLR